MIWHVAFAVKNLETAMDEFGAAFDLTWRPVRVRDVVLVDEHGVEHSLSVTVTFSNESGPAIELFEEQPGTPLAAPAGGAFHHLGRWVDGHGEVAARLDSMDMPCFARTPEREAGVGVFLHRGPCGIGVELCDVNEDRPSLRDLFPTSSPFHGPAVAQPSA
jgi:hypothetical protein